MSDDLTTMSVISSTPSIIFPNNLPSFLRTKTSVKGLVCKYMMISPEDAKELLKYNSSNRPVRQLRINRYARSMKMGRWIPSNDGICFSENGRLLNGQHRLEAVIRSGISIPLLIISGLDEKAFDIIDRGAVRSPSDLAAADGFPNPNLAVAGARSAIGILWAWGGFTIDFGRDRLLDADEILDWMNSHADELKHSVDIISRFRPFRRGLIVGIHFSIGKKNQAWLEDVLKRATDGHPISGAKDPALHLRNLFVINKIRQIQNDDIFKVLKIISTGIKGETPQILKRGSEEKIPSPPNGWRKDAIYPFIPKTDIL